MCSIRLKKKCIDKIKRKNQQIKNVNIEKEKNIKTKKVA